MIIVKCSNCHKEKSENDFSIYHGKRNKQCVACRTYYNNLWSKNPNGFREKRKAYYILHKQRHSAKNFKNSILKKYNLTVEEYNRRLTVQKNQCAICMVQFNQSCKPCVDHCHRTNKVRGLLCRKCNLSLSYIEFKFIEKAKEYLRVNEEGNKESLQNE